MSGLFYSLPKIHSLNGGGGLCLPETNPCVQGCSAHSWASGDENEENQRGVKEVHV